MASIFTPQCIDEVTDSVLDRKVAFVGVFFVIFFVTYAILYALDFYPELVFPEPETAQEEGVQVTTPEVTATAQLPVTQSDGSTNVAVGSAGVDTTHSTYSESGSINVLEKVLPEEIYFARFDRTVPVLNPKSRSIPDLDAALLEGVVRHPDSADLTQNGTVFMLGHSSYLPNVFNKNFQAFNGIQNMVWGDMVVVRSSETEYYYRVDEVYHAKASDLTIPIAGTGQKLTLATCNSFGTTDDRYILEATLVGTEPRS